MTKLVATAKFALLSAAIAAAAILSAGSASSAPHQACAQYATSAVSQYSRSRQRNCGFGGLRWHGAYQLHYKWCRSAPYSAINHERLKRASALQSCGKGGYCTTYARRAVNQYRKSRQLNCGFGGARWHANYRAHLDWCMVVPKAAASNERKARKFSLVKCLAP